jgi:periplasmic protein TonB
MKNLTVALILSILIHIVLLTHYPLKKEENSLQEKSKQPQTTSNIRYAKLQAPQPSVEEVKKTDETKPDNSFKKVEELNHQPKRELTKEAKQTATKPKTVQEVKPTYNKPLPKEIAKTPLENELEKQKKENLSNFLAQPEMELDRNMLDSITKSYLELYGDEYNTFNTVQKVFLQKNLRDIGRITQRYLRYPSLAARLRQAGTNIVEFMLYPNGDITNLMLTNSSGSTSLDDNTVETIRIAYKDYPRPEEPTKIKIYVNYSLY